METTTEQIQQPAIQPQELEKKRKGRPKGSKNNPKPEVNQPIAPVQ